MNRDEAEVLARAIFVKGQDLLKSQHYLSDEEIKVFVADAIQAAYARGFVEGRSNMNVEMRTEAWLHEPITEDMPLSEETSEGES